jgi:hypothetical protein
MCLAMCAFLVEHGIAVRQGLRFLRAELVGILAKRADVLSFRIERRVGYPSEKLRG